MTKSNRSAAFIPATSSGVFCRVSIKIIPIGTLTFSEQGDTARKFVDFVAAPEGKAIFEKHDFTAHPNEKYGDWQ